MTQEEIQAIADEVARDLGVPPAWYFISEKTLGGLPIAPKIDLSNPAGGENPQMAVLKRFADLATAAELRFFIAGMTLSRREIAAKKWWSEALYFVAALPVFLPIVQRVLQGPAPWQNPFAVASLCVLLVGAFLYSFLTMNRKRRQNLLTVLSYTRDPEGAKAAMTRGDAVKVSKMNVVPLAKRLAEVDEVWGRLNI